MLKKIILFICTFMVIYTFNFFIPRLMPGDPFSYTSSVSGEDIDGISEADLETMKAYYGLDRPIGEQFINTISSNLNGDFGQSIHYKKSVIEVIGERLPWTLVIMISTLVSSLLLGVSLALVGLRRKKMDGLIYTTATLLSEIPAFLIGILLLFLVAAQVKFIPLSGNVTPFKSFASWPAYWFDVFIHALLPITAMVIITTPIFYFTARGSFLNVLKKTYVLNAKGKGLSEKQIRYKYIVLNGIFPVITRFFLSVGACLGGTILIENVFAYPGLGKILQEGVMYRDYVLIQGVFLISSLMVLTASFIADLINEGLKKTRGINQ